MNKFIVISIVLSMLFLSITSAQTVNFYISENGEVDVVGQSSLNLTLPSGIEQQGSSIFGITQELTGKIGEIWEFNFSTNLETRINIYLPDYASIENVGEVGISREKNQIVISKTGKEIEFEYKLGQAPENYNYLYVIIGVLAITAAIFIYLRYRKKHRPVKITKNRINRLKIIKDTLNARELAIISKLEEYKKNKIKIKQNHLRKVLNIPKASFSRHIQELDKKKVIIRSGEGKNKFIVLK